MGWISSSSLVVKKLECDLDVGDGDVVMMKEEEVEEGKRNRCLYQAAGTRLITER